MMPGRGMPGGAGAMRFGPVADFVARVQVHPSPPAPEPKREEPPKNPPSNTPPSES